MPAALRRGFDHVIANPPYYAAQRHALAAIAGREPALREDTPLALWVEAAARRLRPGGWLTLILRADRLPEVLGALCDGGLGRPSVLPLAARDGPRGAARDPAGAQGRARRRFGCWRRLILHDGAGA